VHTGGEILCSVEGARRRYPHCWDFPKCGDHYLGELTSIYLVVFFSPWMDLGSSSRSTNHVASVQCGGGGFLKVGDEWDNVADGGDCGSW
jgi:hypothetical protein